MIVYVITEGHYSDYHIIGVMTDKKLAKEFCERHSGKYRDFRAEAFNTDDIMDFTNDMHFWQVKIRKGNFLEITMADDDVDWYFEDRNRVQRMFGDKGVYVYVVAKDAEHAKKIGIDLIMQSRYRKEIEEGGLNGESDIS
jgi:hypothetical protein